LKHPEDRKNKLNKKVNCLECPAENLGAKKMPTVDTSGRFKTKNKKHVAKLNNISHMQGFSVELFTQRRQRLAAHHNTVN